MAVPAQLRVPVHAYPASSMAGQADVANHMHRRFARKWNITRVGWTAATHWNSCGQSCPCCGAAHGERFGSCDSCPAGAHSMIMGGMVPSFVREEQRTQKVVAALDGTSGHQHGRHHTL